MDSRAPLETKVPLDRRDTLDKMGSRDNKVQLEMLVPPDLVDRPETLDTLVHLVCRDSGEIRDQLDSLDHRVLLVHRVQVAIQASRVPGVLLEQLDIPVHLETEELWDSWDKLELQVHLDHKVKLEIVVTKDSQELQEFKDPKVSKVNRDPREIVVPLDLSVQPDHQGVRVPVATLELQAWSDPLGSRVSLDYLDSLVRLVRREQLDGLVRKDSSEILDTQEQQEILESLAVLGSSASKVCQVHLAQLVPRGRLVSRVHKARQVTVVSLELQVILDMQVQQDRKESLDRLAVLVFLASLVLSALQERLELPDNRVNRVQLVLLGHRVLKVLKATRGVPGHWASRGQKVRRDLQGQLGLVEHPVKLVNKAGQVPQARQVIVV